MERLPQHDHCAGGSGVGSKVGASRQRTGKCGLKATHLEQGGPLLICPAQLHFILPDHHRRRHGHRTQRVAQHRLRMDLVHERECESSRVRVGRRLGGGAEEAPRARRAHEDLAHLARERPRAVDDRSARHVRERRRVRAQLHRDAAHARALIGSGDPDDRRRREITRARGARAQKQLCAHLLRAHPARAAAVQQRLRLCGHEVGWQLSKKGAYRVVALEDADPVNGRVVRQLVATVTHAMPAVLMHRAASVPQGRRSCCLCDVLGLALVGRAEEAVAASIQGECVVALGGARLEQVHAPVHERRHLHVIAKVGAIALGRHGRSVGQRRPRVDDEHACAAA